MWLITSLLVLSFLIFFHELGHYLVARIFGVKVEVFSVGFGKKILSKTINGTQYALSIIPLGGYVKMKGQDDLNPNKFSNDDDSYNTKAHWKKICILLAGSGFNILLAFIIYIIIAMNGITAVAPKIGKILPNSPAIGSGLQKGDEIIKINEVDIKTWKDLYDKITQSIEEIEITYKRNGDIFQTKLKPQIKDGKNIFGEDIKIGFIGIAASGEIIKLDNNFIEVFKFAIQETLYSAKLILLSLQKLILRILPISELGGPISVVQVISNAQEHGVIALIGLSALISINLGILNLLPIPALDGGHIVFTIYEWIAKKSINKEIMYRLIIGGWVILLSLMALGIYNDISRIIAGVGQ